MEIKPLNSSSPFIDQAVVPGDVILDLSTLENSTIKLGSGLRQDGDTISAMKAGRLRFSKPNKYWIEGCQKRYVPCVGDTILGIVADTRADNFFVDIKGPTLAFLPVLAFEGGTRRNIPKFEFSQARGLFQMPPFRLINRYFLVRAGESENEKKGIINTNPVAKTSVDNGLSNKGKKQTLKAALELKALGACDGNCWIWPSITQRSYQAAEIIAAVNGINRSQIVPEYSFLDARGLGSYEGKNLDSISEVYESDSLSPKIKPPPIDDGTPNESVSDVFVRVTQLMSILETQYSGDTIIIVSPDSDNLTILQAGLLGLDLRRHMKLSFSAGEVRRVDPTSIPAYKQPASAVYKCSNPPPNCN